MIRVIKKYPNRRLYDTETSAYITLADVKQFVLDSQAFEVRDARTGEDLTRSILLQIILEEESGGIPMFSSDMLANIIRYYGHAMQGLMGSYLERSIGAFHEAQRKFQDQTKSLYGNVPAFGPEAWNKLIQKSATGAPNVMSDYLEKSAASVMSMQEDLRKQAMQMFSSFPFPVPKEMGGPAPENPATKSPPPRDQATGKPRSRKK
ncbi:MAG: polyhydroxyalkanoate synthesis repressor PhaR [Betaproteobacteria bacterium]|nr:polyhydroxyalkanoate synthesis repressor PhaR [Betaproteobacteria bacterium]